MQTKQVLKTASQPTNLRPEHQEKSETRKPKHCPYHDRDGHSLEECMAFGTMTLEEKTEWIFKAELCCCCLSEEHWANRCTRKIECSICKDHRHTALLHKERPAESVELGETIGAKCTSACKAVVSCSKLLLVDVHSKERPRVIHRVYIIIDEQSNSTLISSELDDELGAVAPVERYYLTTCSGGREIKYGRRLTGVTVQSPTGEKSGLPTLIECDSIPNNKREIPTPEMARRFPHLEEIVRSHPSMKVLTFTFLSEEMFWSYSKCTNS